MHTSNARRNNSECTPGPDVQCTGRRGFHCLAQRALDLPQRYRAPASFLSLEFSPCISPIALVVIIRKKKKKEERKRREEASTIYFTITASSDIGYCRHNTATPIDLDRVPVSFREVVHTHAHTNVVHTVTVCDRVVVTTPDHQFSPGRLPPPRTRSSALSKFADGQRRPRGLLGWPRIRDSYLWTESSGKDTVYRTTVLLTAVHGRFSIGGEPSWYLLCGPETDSQWKFWNINMPRSASKTIDLHSRRDRATSRRSLSCDDREEPAGSDGSDRRNGIGARNGVGK